VREARRQEKEARQKAARAPRPRHRVQWNRHALRRMLGLATAR
jgi:hypothetical protein